MSDNVHYSPALIYSAGTQIVILNDLIGQNGSILHPEGSVGVVVKSPGDLKHSYRIRFHDGVEEALKPEEITMLAKYKEGGIGDSDHNSQQNNLFDRVIYKCVIGSRAYGLEDDQSDTDYRGFYLPPTDLKWSLYGVPDQIEHEENQEVYWELQKFLILALKANPNVLECLYSPLIEKITPLAEELLEMKSIFLSRMVYQTYNGYVMSQFKKLQSDIRNKGEVKWKHVMHLIRLLISGANLLRDGVVTVRVDQYREELLAIKRGEVPWEETEKWRISLHTDLDKAMKETKLPHRPDYEKANIFLIKARQAALARELP